MFLAVIYILCICGGAALIWWAVGELGTPDPLARIVKVLTICVAIVLVGIILVSLVGGSVPALPPIK